MMTGMRMKVMIVRRQLALNMNTSTMAACVRLRSPTFRFRQIWSDTVVVSADSLLVISPAHAPQLCMLQVENWHEVIQIGELMHSCQAKK